MTFSQQISKLKKSSSPFAEQFIIDTVEEWKVTKNLNDIEYWAKNQIQKLSAANDYVYTPNNHLNKQIEGIKNTITIIKNVYGK